MRKTLTMISALPVVGAVLVGAHAAQAGEVTAPPPRCGGSTSCDYAAALVADRLGARDEDNEILRFRDVRGPASSLDLGKQGASPGDTLFFDNTLRRGDRAVGRFPSRCTQVTERGDFHCQGTLLLQAGTIELATTTDFSEIVAAVTGGTGRFVEADGEVTITPTSKDGVNRLVVRLTD